jgi:hypothetical protein
LNVGTEEKERAERTEGIALSKTRSKKRKRAVTRPAAKSSSSTSGSRDRTIRKPPPRRWRQPDPSTDTSTPSPKKRLVEVSPVRRSPRVANRNVQVAQVGMRVFARWLDRQYYSGEIRGIIPQGRFNVAFDDGHIQDISASDLLILDVVPVGSPVLVLRGPSEYDEAVVVGCCSMRAEPGYVVRCEGKVQRYPRSCVALSPLQALNLIGSSSSSPARGQKDTDSPTTSIASHSTTSSSSMRFVTGKSSKRGSLRQSPIQPIFDGLVFAITNSRSADGLFNKEEMIRDITSSGGRVVGDLTDSTIDDHSRCLLVSSGPCRTLKYLQALACGVPCVSYNFVIDSVKQSHLLSMKEYLLSAGFSYERNRNVECIEPSGKVMSQILEGTRIMVDGDLEFKSNWSKILAMCGAVIRQKLPSRAAVMSDNEEERRSCWCDCVVSNGQPSASLLQHVDFLGIPVLSVNWAVQCLINRRKVAFNEDERFLYNNKDA